MRSKALKWAPLLGIPVLAGLALLREPPAEPTFTPLGPSVRTVEAPPSAPNDPAMGFPVSDQRQPVPVVSRSRREPMAGSREEVGVPERRPAEAPLPEKLLDMTEPTLLIDEISSLADTDPGAAERLLKRVLVDRTRSGSLRAKCLALLTAMPGALDDHALSELVRDDEDPVFLQAVKLQLSGKSGS